MGVGGGGDQERATRIHIYTYIFMIFPREPAESFEAKPLNNVGKSARRGELQLSRGTL